MTSGRGQSHGANRGAAYRRPGRVGPSGGGLGERGGITGRGPGLHGEQESQVRDRRREWAVGRVIDPVRNRLPGDQAVSRFDTYQPAKRRRDPNGTLPSVAVATGARPAASAAPERRMRLANITAEVHTPVVAGGTENWVPGTIEHLAAPLVGMWLVTAGDITDCLALTADRSCYCAIPAWSPPLPSARPHDHTWVRTIAAYVPGSRPRAAAAARRTGSSGRKPLR